VEPSLPYERGAAPTDELAEILTHAACDLADDVGAAVIAVSTQTGATARQVSRYRPQRPIVAAATCPVVLQQLALEWAVVPVAVGESTSIETEWAQILDEVLRHRLAGAGDAIVLTGRADAPMGGSTSHVSVHRLEEGRDER
jgi:pyruvate kinase